MAPSGSGMVVKSITMPSRRSMRADDRLAAVDRGDGGAQVAPDRAVVVQRLAPGGDRLDMRMLVERLPASFHMRWKAGLCRRTRPSLPNTATASAR